MYSRQHVLDMLQEGILIHYFNVRVGLGARGVDPAGVPGSGPPWSWSVVGSTYGRTPLLFPSLCYWRKCYMSLHSLILLSACQDLVSPETFLLLSALADCERKTGAPVSSLLLLLLFQRQDFSVRARCDSAVAIL